MDPEETVTSELGKRVVAIVQARMTSRRLPGKVLMEIAGRPVLGHIVDRLDRCSKIQEIVVATSSDPSDDPIAEFADANGIRCYRGSLEDVAGRMLGAARESACDAFVRVNGDSPLMVPDLVDTGVDLFRSEDPDLVTNVRTRTFPKGQSVEVIALDSMARACREMSTDSEREHVTRHFYLNQDRFRIESFESPENHGQVQLSVDTREDLVRVDGIFGRLRESGSSFALGDLIEAARFVDRDADSSRASP